MSQIVNVSLEEYQTAVAFLREESSKQGIFHPSDTLTDKIKSVIRQYEDHAMDALRAAKEFRDRQLIDLRAFAMVLEMVCAADTHKEKNARLRGCLEMVNTSVGRLEREEFELSTSRRPHFDRLFGTDAPTRHYVEKIHELQERLKAFESSVKSVPSVAKNP